MFCVISLFLPAVPLERQRCCSDCLLCCRYFCYCSCCWPSFTTALSLSHSQLIPFSTGVDPYRPNNTHGSTNKFISACRWGHTNNQKHKNYLTCQCVVVLTDVAGRSEEQNKVNQPVYTRARELETTELFVVSFLLVCMCKCLCLCQRIRDEVNN